MTSQETQFEDGARWVDFYNDLNQLVKRVTYDADQVVQGVTLYEYDAQGDNIAADIYEGDEEKKIHQLAFTYVDHKVVEAIEYGTDGNMLYKTVYEYVVDASGARTTHQKIYDTYGNIISEDISPDV